MQHLAIILDGNRRWARENGLSKFAGHKEGFENLKRISKAVIVERGIKYLSVFAFSTENWQRSASEVKYLMSIIKRALTGEVAFLAENGIRLRWFGSSEGLEAKLVDDIKAAEQATAGGKAGQLNVCFNYGSRRDIAAAARKLVEDGEAVTEEALAGQLQTAGVPDPDMIIRPSGEQRLSNFLLWEAAYAELYFAKVYWPDFDEHELDKALAEYARRQRRFGK